MSPRWAGPAPAAFVFAGAFAQAAHGPGEVVPAPLPRVLVYTVSAGFEHDVVRRPAPDQLSLVERALVEIGRESGRFEAVPTRDAAQFDPERLAGYGAVFFYTTGDLPLSEARRAALFEFVRRGKGFVGAHSATDTFYSVPEYGRLVGGYFDGHPWHEAVRVRVEDRDHLATRHLGASFGITDEIYQFRSPYDRRKLRVLLSLDVASVDARRPGVNRTDGDFALAWTHDFGDGRVFYTALGHRPEVWADARFRRHLAGGVRWALRDEPPPVEFAPEDAALAAFARENPGDPARGWAVFRRDSGPMCARCHPVHGEGPQIGPDLSDLALRLTPAQIVEQVLAPSAEIDPAWRATLFELRDGTLVAGRVRSEGPAGIELWDADGRLRTIDPAEVAARRASDASLMPSGLARTLAPGEFADLLAWLGTLRGG